MNSQAVLSLIGDLYGQIMVLQAKVTELEAKKKT